MNPHSPMLRLSLALMAVFVLAGCNRTQTLQTLPAVAAPKVSAPTLAITGMERYGSPRAGRIGMKGTARNESSRTLGRVLCVMVRALNGKKQVKTFTAFENLAPKESRPFNLSVVLDKPGDREARYSFGFALPGNKPLRVIYPPTRPAKARGSHGL